MTGTSNWSPLQNHQLNGHHEFGKQWDLNWSGSFMLHAGIREVSYLWGEELAFCSKFAPFVGPRNIEPLIAEIESAAAQIAQNGNPTIVFTHFALSVSKMIKHL